jgi:uncharacterized protein YkwD
MLPSLKIFRVVCLIFIAIAVISAAFTEQTFCQSVQPKNARMDELESTANKLEFLEVYCFDEVNRHRKEHGLEPLLFSERLLNVARAYSRRMAEEGFFSHTDPQGKTASDRVREAKLTWSAMGENLLNIKGFINPVPPAVEQWMKSEAHSRNILDPTYQYSAVGVWTASDGMVYFTQIFLGTHPLKPPKNK